MKKRQKNRKREDSYKKSEQTIDTLEHEVCELRQDNKHLIKTEQMIIEKMTQLQDDVSDSHKTITALTWSAIIVSIVLILLVIYVIVL